MLRIEQILETDFPYRQNRRSEKDIDIFIDLEGRTLNLSVKDDRVSRLQFPKVKFLLFRIDSDSNVITIHMMRDIDLFSAFANLEWRLGDGEKILLLNREGAVEMRFTDR